MTHTPCVVIPNFNHGYALREIVERVREYGLPIIVVNDGSIDTTAETLDALAVQYTEVIPVHRAVNGGKGAAILDGFRVAQELGYSHAICIDGDGQHEVRDIPRFVEASRSHPEALILGRPLFGPDAPLIRRIGREFSNLAVAASAWSFCARDVLCGFRCYPLRTLAASVDLTILQPRMGFDVEIVVRALWAGMDVVNVPTQVVYPRGGISHFRYVGDNKALIALEVRLILLGLWKGPRHIVRSFIKSFRTKERTTWYQVRERGGLFGLRFLLRVFEVLGRWPLLSVMLPVVAYMFLFGGTTRRAAVDFQQRLHADGPKPVSRMRAYWTALQQFWEFGVSIVDKVVSWRNGLPLERFTWTGRAEVKALLAQNQGVILMGAHVGNIEVVRALGDSRQVVINALMFTANSRHFKAFLEEINATSYLRVHDLTSVDATLIFTLQEALARGEFVALLADRVPKLSEGREVRVPFLGDDAAFPEGPWILASMLAAPVYTVFSMREGGNRYHVEFARLCDRVELPRDTRREAIHSYASTFANKLGDIVSRYPTQWFNFYDFWLPRSGSGGV